MKMKALFLLSVALLIVTAVTPAEAHHYVYLSEDPTYQYPPPDSLYTDIWVMWQWQQGSTASWWVVPSSDPEFANDVAVARTNWFNNISQLGYSPATSEATANIRFRYDPCPGNPTALGCAPITEFEDRPTENASYVRRETVYINPNPNPDNQPQDPDWTQAGRRGIIAHELGHVYGMHEQYVDHGGSGCWYYTNSVMDTGRRNTGGQYETCDRDEFGAQLQGPTALDLHRVYAYWGNSDYGHWRGDDLAIFGVATSPPWSPLRTVAQFKWADLTWTESYHYVEVYYSSDGQNWNPTPFHYTSVYPEIGVHYLTQPRAIGIEVNRANYGQNPGWFRACARPYFWAFGRYGTERCSNAVELQ